MVYKTVALAFLFVWISGCSIKMPPITEYKIQMDGSKVAQDAQRCKEKSLKVYRALGSSNYHSQYIYYILGKHKQYSYTQARWAEPPSVMITDALSRSLRESKLFDVVIQSSSRAQGDLGLEIYIEDFMHYFESNATKGYVKASVHLSLIDIQKNQVLDANTFSVQLASLSDDAKGGVEALEKALEKIVEENILWLERVCR